MPEQKPRNSRKQLIVMFLIGGATMLGAFAVYFGASSGGLWGTTNRGVFVDPPVNIEALGVTDLGGQPATTDGTWWLWVVQANDCAADCEQALAQLQALHILLNRDAERVRRALVTAVPVELPALRERFPDLRFRVADTRSVAPGIYIIDPHGNLVLRYRLAEAGKPVLDDLKRLLKVSQIG